MPMRESNRRSLQNERGSGLVEMALAAPLLFLLLFGIAELGRAVWLYDALSHGAREAARYAIVRGAESGRAASAGDIETYVHNVSGLGTAVVTTTWDPDNQPGSVVQVQVSVPFDSVVAFLPSVSLQSTSRMVISY